MFGIKRNMTFGLLIIQVNYEGKYQYWQMTSSGKIDGINGPVDVNIFYQ